MKRAAPDAAVVMRIIARLNTGGPAIHTVLLTAGLDPSRYRSILVTGNVMPTEGDMSYYAERHGITPYVIPDFGRHVGPRGLVRTLVTLFRLMRRERPRIIHTHTATAGILGRATAVAYNVWARLSGRPRAVLVHTFHGHVFHGYFGPRLSAALRVLERALARRTDRIIAVSEAVKRDLVSRYRICPDEKVTVVPLGLDFDWVADLPRTSNALHQKHSIPEGVVTLGHVARLTAIKNHELFLNAMAYLKDQPVCGIIVGDGERRAELEAMAVSLFSAETPVIFAGWETEQGNIYGGLDVVCLTSRNEGTPVALIEAMAAGKPFVSTDVGGVRDLALGPSRPDPRGFEVFDNGIIVRGDDPEAFAAALRVLIEHPELRTSMGTRGQAVAVSRYSKGRLVEDVQGMYDALLGRAHVEVE